MAVHLVDHGLSLRMCRYQSKNMEVDIKMISSESFFKSHISLSSISALIQSKTFLRPLSQKNKNVRPF